MANVTSVISRAIRERVGWNKIGIAISILIVIIAVAILLQLLRDIEVDKVVAALRAKSIRDVLIAGIFVAIGYVALTFYDFFALRTIGRDDVPYRIAAFTGFTCYTIGHNLGATVLTAGAIRLRIYSAWGLGIIDIAKIAFITGLTFWLGNAFVLGAGMAYAPEAASAVNQLPPWINRAIGVCGLVIIVAYLLWLIPRPRIIGRSSWQIVLPSPRSTLVQIGIGFWTSARAPSRCMPCFQHILRSISSPCSWFSSRRFCSGSQATRPEVSGSSKWRCWSGFHNSPGKNCWRPW
jgi:glycosyltransferase 2 family protein